MHTHVIGPPAFLAGAAAVVLVACGDASDFPVGPSASASPVVVALPTLSIPTAAPTPTVDPQLRPLWAMVTHDTTVLNADLDSVEQQCDVYITDVGACRSVLKTMQAQLGPMLTQLRAMQVGDDLQTPYSDLEQAITILQAGCADDLRYLGSRNHDDNATATRELNKGYGLLDQAQMDMPPDPSATPVSGGS
jgi:hypothetical protein